MKPKLNVRCPDLVLFVAEIVFGAAVGLAIDAGRYGGAAFMFTFGVIMAIDRGAALIQRSIETATDGDSSC